MNILYIAPFSHGVNVSPELYKAYYITLRGHNTYFYTIKTPYIKYKNKNIKLAQIPQEIKMVYIDNWFLIPEIPYPIVNFVREIKELKEIIKNNDIEVLHIYYPEYLLSAIPALTLRKLLSSLKVSVVVSVNSIPGIDWFYGVPSIDIIGKIYSKIIIPMIIKNNIDIILPHTLVTKNTLLSMGVPENKIVYITPFGVDTHKFKPISKNQKINLRERYNIPTDSFVILYTGRLAKVKRLDLLIKAFSEYKRSNSNAILLIVGDGPEKPYLKKLASSLGVLDKIIFTGFVPHDKLHELYQLADMFAILSSGEGPCLSLMEACATGLPCLATKVGGNIEKVIDNINGFLIREDILKPSIIAEYFAKINEKHRKFSKNSRRIAEKRFNWKNIIDAHLQLYHEIRRW